MRLLAYRLLYGFIRYRAHLELAQEIGTMKLVEWLWNGELRSKVCDNEVEELSLLAMLSLNPSVTCIVIWGYVGHA